MEVAGTFSFNVLGYLLLLTGSYTAAQNITQVSDLINLFLRASFTGRDLLLYATVTDLFLHIIVTDLLLHATVTDLLLHFTVTDLFLHASFTATDLFLHGSLTGANLFLHLL